MWCLATTSLSYQHDFMSFISQNDFLVILVSTACWGCTLLQHRVTQLLKDLPNVWYVTLHIEESCTLFTYRSKLNWSFPLCPHGSCDWHLLNITHFIFSRYLSESSKAKFFTHIFCLNNWCLVSKVQTSVLHFVRRGILQGCFHFTW